MSAGKISKGKLACLAAAIAIGAALFAAPAQARHGGGDGAWRGPALHSAAFHGAAFHGAAWHGAAWHGAAWHGAAWHGRFFPHRHFAFFHRRHFGPFFGLYASGYSSCWSWVPTRLGWRYAWVCGPYGYGYF
jgi:hypothetical protein